MHKVHGNWQQSSIYQNFIKIVVEKLGWMWSLKRSALDVAQIKLSGWNVKYQCVLA